MKKKAQVLATGGLMIVSVLLVFSFKAEKKVVDWTYQVECVNSKEVKVTATGKIAKGWHVYDVEPMEGLFAPVATGFVLVDSLNLSKKGKTTSSTKVHEEYDPALEMKSRYYTNELVMEQRFNILHKTDSIRFMIEFQACDDRQCVFPFPERTALVMPDKCK